MAGKLEIGSLVTIAGRGHGMLEMDNEDGTWSIGFDDGSEGDFPLEQIVHKADPVEQIALAGGARVVPPDLWQEEKLAGWTRFVCFSDTHGLHDQIPRKHYVKADVLLHAGDFTNTGEVEQVKSLANWLKAYPASHKVVIAGNHDITFQPSYYERAWPRFHKEPYDCEAARNALVDSGCCTYLEDDAIDVMGYRIYGSPHQPEFCDWAFNLPRGDACKAAWEKIPQDADVLLIHGPPHGIRDKTSSLSRPGCEDLLRAIRTRIVPVLVFGHIHESYGVSGDGATLCINASTCTHSYRPTNPPIVFDLPPASQLRQAAASMSAPLAST